MFGEVCTVQYIHYAFSLMYFVSTQGGIVLASHFSIVV